MVWSGLVGKLYNAKGHPVLFSDMAGNLKEKVLHFKKEFTSHFFKCLGLCFLAYVPWAFGYLQLSFAWIILLLSFGAFLQSGHLLNQRQRKLLKNINDEDDIKDIWPSMPSWIYFSEKEHALWVNRILDQMWPYVEDMVQAILKQSVEPAIQQSLPGPLQCLRFDKISLGQIPPYITNVKTYRVCTSKRDDEFIMDLDVVYNGDADFVLAVKKVKLGVSDFQLHGSLRVILKPLIPDFNPVGGVTVFFLNRPKISFDLTNLLSVLDIPGIKSTLLDITEDVVASFVVLPNRIAVPLSLSVDAADLQYPIPDGVMRVQLIEAKDLIKADMAIFGEGSSDPYAVLEVGAQKFRTKTKKSNCNPVWKETFEAFIDNTEGQELFVKVYDEDIASSDEKVGEVDLQVARVFEKGISDLWLPLEGVDEGKIHMKLTWFALSSNPEDLRQATPINPTVAAVFVKIISAVDLPKDLRDEEDPKMLLCDVSVCKTTQKTYSVSSVTPTWNQGLRFLVSNPRTQTVRINMMEDDKLLCHVKFDLKRIENVPGMTHEGAFPLIGPGFERSALKCKVVLRAMKAPQVEEPDGNSCKEVQNATNDTLNQRKLRKSLPGRLNASVPQLTETEVDSEGHGRLHFRNDASSSSMTSSTWGMSSLTSLEQSTEELTCRGEVKLGLRYDHSKNKLIVVLIRAEGLKSRDAANRTNPYVRLYLLPDKTKKSRRKTAASRGNVNPVFNETFEYDVGLEELKDRDLDLVVKNARPGFNVRRGWNLIGRTTIQLSELALSSGITITCELKK